MMIGDLLAQITGDGDAGSTTPSAQPPKRKAGDDFARPSVSKAPRIVSSKGDSNSRHENISGNSIAHGPLDLRGKASLQIPSHGAEAPRSRPVPSASSSAKSGLPSAKSSNSSNSASRYGGSASLSTLAMNRSRGPVPTTSSGAKFDSAAASSASKPAPKKGSYLEIMERAKAAQAAMGQVGKIQHKPLEKGPTKRERMIVQAEEARSVKNRNGKAMGGRQPSKARPLASKVLSGPRESRSGTNRRPTSNAIEAQKAPVHVQGRNDTARRKPAPQKEEKQPKKAATATTGYQGTARPRPGLTTSVAASRPSAGTGDAQSRPRVPFGGPRRSRYDEEMDEEMDDFIEYDDDEQDAGRPERRGHGWASDEDDGFEDESDMEAGISDIDEEEHLAERVARLEDAQQEALERKMKAEKEQRKRQAMTASNYRRNSGSGLLRR